MKRRGFPLLSSPSSSFLLTMTRKCYWIRWAMSSLSLFLPPFYSPSYLASLPLSLAVSSSFHFTIISLSLKVKHTFNSSSSFLSSSYVHTYTYTFWISLSLSFFFFLSSLSLSLFPRFDLCLFVSSFLFLACSVPSALLVLVVVVDDDVVWWWCGWWWCACAQAWCLIVVCRWWSMAFFSLFVFFSLVIRLFLSLSLSSLSLFSFG